MNRRIAALQSYGQLYNLKLTVVCENDTYTVTGDLWATGHQQTLGSGAWQEARDQTLTQINWAVGYSEDPPTHTPTNTLVSAQ